MTPRWFVSLSVAAGLMVAGCGMLPPMSPEPLAVATEPQPRRDATYLEDMVRGSADTPGPTALDSAMVWAKKYADATEKLVAVEKEKRALEQQSGALAEELKTVGAQLAQARHEVDDANAMILETREELAKWKLDVLGFREEIRGGLKALTESQIKVLKILGGEPTPAEAPTTQPAANTLADRGRDLP